MSGRPLVTTERHPRVSGARRLAKRAFRYQDKRFLVEGPTNVAEALAEPGALLELFVTSDAADRHGDLVSAAEHAGVPVHEVSGKVMAAVAQTVTPSGVLGVAAFRHRALEDVVAGAKLVVVLVAARDPGNAGTIVRAADAMGADAVVFTGEAVDPYNPKCARAAAGSLFHVPFAVGVPLADAVAALRAQGVRLLATSATAEHAIAETDLTGPTAWLFGNEAWGLPPESAAQADLEVRVPLYGRAESLNLATAAAVCLYASAEAQRSPGGCRR